MGGHIMEGLIRWALKWAQWTQVNWDKIAIGIVVGVIVYLLTHPHQPTRLIFWVWHRFRPLKKGVLVFPRGSVELLSKRHFAHRATTERLRHFYAGGNLAWDIIATNGDVERDQLGELLKELRTRRQELRLICVVAAARAGKSTLAWRAAAELFQKDGAIVLWIKRRDDPEVWYQLGEFYQRIRRPIYVLADDLFRNPEVVEALRQLSPSLQVTILATSRLSEPVPSGLPSPMIQCPLAPPSQAEKERALRKLNKQWVDLTPEQRRRLDDAADFAVAMIELTEGRDHRQAVTEWVSSLRTQDEVVYRAYEYICFVTQYDLSVPESIIGRLDDQGRFFRLPLRPRAKGFISYDEALPGMLRGRHPVTESIAFSCYGRDPVTVLTEILRHVNVAIPLERRFAGHLCRVLLENEPGIPSQMRAELLQFIREFRKLADTVGELIIWRRVFHAFEERHDAEACVDVALTIPPKSSWECNVLVRLYRERGREPEALPILHDWLVAHPEDSFVRTRYLGLVEQHAPNELPQVMKETRDWVVAHPEDSSVRTRYLGLVEQHAPNELPQVMKETRDWLVAHPDQGVRVKLIGILCRTGQNEVALAVLKEALPSDLADAKALDLGILEQYLRLLRDTLEPETVIRLGRRLSEASPLHKANFANWLRDNGYIDEAEKLYEELCSLPPAQTTKFIQRRVNYGYGSLLLLTGRPKEAEARFKGVLATHKGHVAARAGLAQALQAQGEQAKRCSDLPEAEKRFEEAEKELKHAMWWAKLAGGEIDPIYYQLGWLYINWERYQKALEAFCGAIQEAREEHFSNYWGVGKALMGLGRFEQALAYLCKALERPGGLRPPADEEIPKDIETCLGHLYPTREGGSDRTE